MSDLREDLTRLLESMKDPGPEKKRVLIGTEGQIKVWKEIFGDGVDYIVGAEPQQLRGGYE